MKEINLTRIQNRSKLELIKEFLIDQEAIYNIFLSGIGAYTLAQGDLFSLCLGVFAIGANATVLYGKWKNPLSVDLVISKLLIKSKTFEELTKSYEEYITKLAEYIRSLGFKSSQEIIMYLENMMEQGLLSVNLRHQYKDFKYDNEYLTNLTGTRVITGKCVCRHMATFFADVLEKMGYNACVSTVKLYEDIPSLEDLTTLVEYNHAVVTISNEYGKYIYCPTHGIFFDKFNAEEYKDTAAYTSPRVVRINQKPKENINMFVMLAEEQAKYNFKRMELASQVVTTPNISLDPYELRSKSKMIDSAFRKTFGDAYKFRLEQEDVMMDIARKTLTLSPCSDEPITNWRVK